MYKEGPQYLGDGLAQHGTGRGGGAAVQFRGRAGAAIAPRGRGAFIGRGRPGTFSPSIISQDSNLKTGHSVPQGPASQRAASPLPPNVPTGPRNPGNRYKDRDNNSLDVSGLDYGGGGGGGSIKDGGDRESEERTSRYGTQLSNLVTLFEY